MKVAVSVRRAVVVDDDVHTLDIDTTAKNVGGHEDTLLEGLEGGVARDTEEPSANCGATCLIGTHRSS